MGPESYNLQISKNCEDPAWDAFLERTAGGDHVQTSLWAQVKASLGWQSIRLVARCDDEIVGGAQILLRPLPIFGSVGFVSRGPVFAYDDPHLFEIVVKELQRIARANAIHHLSVQPLHEGQQLKAVLSEKGFRPTSVDLAPRATTILNLEPDLDTILANMDSGTRYNVRLGGRKGIRVRFGTAADIHTFYRFLSETAQRKNFYVYPETYYRKMWETLHPHGHIQLLLAEFEGETISTQLMIAFGESVINKMSVWSGNHGNRRPNEALQWATIKWSKENGYRYYDFEGIKLSAAKALLREEPLPDSVRQSVTSFKLGFGGEVAVFPENHDYLYNSVFRWTFRNLFPKVRDNKTVKNLLKRLRTH